MNKAPSGLFLDGLIINLGFLVGFWGGRNGSGMGGVW